MRLVRLVLQDGSVELVNPDRVTKVKWAPTSGSLIYLTDGKSVRTNYDLEEVRQRLEEK